MSGIWSYFMGILPLLITLSVLILIHEWGHFAAAKWVGIQVPRFSLGLGPKVWGFRRGETEYVLSAIPLGGYVKMAGMEDDEAQSTLEAGGDGEPPVDPERTFDSKPIWARTLVISAGVIMNLLFAVVAFAAVAGIYGVAVGTNQVAPAPDAPGGAAAIPRGARIVAIGDHSVASLGDIGEGLQKAPAGPVPVRLDDGRTVTPTIPREPEDRLRLWQSIPPYHPAQVGMVEGGSPAERAGFRPGDRVVAVDARPLDQWPELVRTVRGSPGRPLRVTVERAGTTTTLTLTPSTREERDEGGERVAIGRAGFSAMGEPISRREVGVIGAISYGFTETWATAAAIGDVLRKLLTGQMSTRNLGGLISIGEASTESARLGVEYFLGFLALFSVNLAILNLLPIPILDGGHLMFLLAEAVRGRPLSVDTRVRLSQLGLIVVIGLMLLANGNDVVRLVQGWMGG